jgi:hypothetical protein
MLLVSALCMYHLRGISYTEKVLINELPATVVHCDIVGAQVAVGNVEGHMHDINERY